MFEKISLEEINSIPLYKRDEEFKKQGIMVAIDLELKFFSFDKLKAEHKFYELICPSNEILRGISIERVTDDEVIMTIGNKEETIKVGELKTITDKIGPFVSTTNIMVTNVRYGKMYDI